MAHVFKYSGGKVRYDLVDPEAVHGLALAMTHGTTKYPENSWRKVPVKEYVAAYQRHMHKHLRYIETGILACAYDVDSGLLHLDHAMACLMILRWFAVNMDDSVLKREQRNEKTREATQKETV
jgi:hypothetical protein